MLAEWPIWRLVADEKASLREIDEHWTVSDVLDANEALDVMQDAGAPVGNPTPPMDVGKPRKGTAVARNTRPPSPRR